MNVAYGMDCTLQCMHGSCEIGKADFSVFDKYNTHHNLPFANITHVRTTTNTAIYDIKMSFFHY